MAKIQNKAWSAYFSIVKELVGKTSEPLQAAAGDDANLALLDAFDHEADSSLFGANAYTQYAAGSNSYAVGEKPEDYQVLVDSRPLNGDLYSGSDSSSIFDTYRGFLSAVDKVVDRDSRDQKRLDKLFDKLDDIDDNDDPKGLIVGLDEQVRQWREGKGNNITAQMDGKSGKIQSFEADGEIEGTFQKGPFKFTGKGEGEVYYRDATDLEKFSIEIETKVRSFAIDRRRWFRTSWIQQYKGELMSEERVRKLFDEEDGGLSRIPSQVVLAWRPTIKITISAEDGKNMGIDMHLQGAVSVQIFDIGFQGNVKVQDDSQTRGSYTFILEPEEASSAKPILLAVTSATA